MIKEIIKESIIKTIEKKIQKELGYAMAIILGLIGLIFVSVGSALFFDSISGIQGSGYIIVGLVIALSGFTFIKK